MKLDELLNKPFSFQILSSTEDLYEVSFNAAGREIRFHAFNEGNEDGDDQGSWDISFGEVKKDEDGEDLIYGKSGSGKEFNVFATLKAILKGFISTRKPKRITFSADKADGNRARLYATMFKKNMPVGWKLEQDNDPSDSVTFFQMIKK